MYPAKIKYIQYRLQNKTDVTSFAFNSMSNIWSHTTIHTASVPITHVQLNVSLNGHLTSYWLRDSAAKRFWPSNLMAAHSKQTNDVCLSEMFSDIFNSFRPWNKLFLFIWYNNCSLTVTRHIIILVSIIFAAIQWNERYILHSDHCCYHWQLYWSLVTHYLMFFHLVK